MQSINLSTETACVYQAATASLNASVDCFCYNGLDNEDIQVPAVICCVNNAEEDFPQSGVWHCKTSISVKEAAYDTTRSVASLSDTIFKAFLTGSIEQDLTNKVSNLSVYSVIPEGIETTTSGDAWVQTLKLDIVCVLT